MAQEWFEQFEGAGLDGVIAKPLAGTYEQNDRTMLKIKHVRTADCVVAGYRTHKTGDDLVGSACSVCTTPSTLMSVAA